MGGGGGGGSEGGLARVNEFFSTKNPNLKKKIGGVDGWTEEQAQTNLPLHNMH